MSIHIPPALTHRRFRLLWAGLFISVAGSRMQFWAILWHIRELTDQPIALGGIGLVRVLPIIVFSLVGGAIADVFDRRKVMFATQTIFILNATLLGWLTISGKIAIWNIYLLTAIEAVASSFDLPARQSLTPNLVPSRDLPNAFSLQSMAFTVGSIIGPALSGIVIANGGLSVVYFINAATYLALVWAVIRIGPVTQLHAQRRALSLHDALPICRLSFPACCWIFLRLSSRPQMHCYRSLPGISWQWGKPVTAGWQPLNLLELG